jgi:flagellar motor switch protein FliN/FliY
VADENDKPEDMDSDLVADAPEAEAEREPTVMDAMIGASGGEAGQNIDAMLNVGLNVQIILGETRMPISQLLKLSRGSIIELDKRIGQPVDVVINNRLVARGDLVKLAGDRIGVSLIEIVKDYVSEI